MDDRDKERRRAAMRAVRGKNTKPELRVRKVLHAAGYRYRLHRRDLPGTPDIVLPKHRTIIFVHGCFWHGHDGCRRASVPSTNVDFWRTKLERNRERDADAKLALGQLGWRVATIWECEIKTPERTEVMVLLDPRGTSYKKRTRPLHGGVRLSSTICQAASSFNAVDDGVRLVSGASAPAPSAANALTARMAAIVPRRRVDSSG